MNDQYLLHRQNIKLGLKEKSGPKDKQPVNQVSPKRKEDKKEYIKIVKQMMAESDLCEIKEDGCTGKASGLHHMKKRSPDTYLDKRFLKRACDNCNYWAELNPLEAIKKGHSISKHKIEVN